MNHDFLFRSNSLHITTFFNLDWATDKYDRPSIPGSWIFLGYNLIMWTAKKHKTVGKCMDVVWLCLVLFFLLLSLLIRYSCPTKTHWGGFSDFHFKGEMVQANQMQVKYIPNTSQGAYVFTKGLLLRFLRSLGYEFSFMKVYNHNTEVQEPDILRAIVVALYFLPVKSLLN